jgi:hypothetical protein
MENENWLQKDSINSIANRRNSHYRTRSVQEDQIHKIMQEKLTRGHKPFTYNEAEEAPNRGSYNSKILQPNPKEKISLLCMEKGQQPTTPAIGQPKVNKSEISIQDGWIELTQGRRLDTSGEKNETGEGWSLKLLSNLKTPKRFSTMNEKTESMSPNFDFYNLKKEKYLMGPIAGQ